MKPLISIYGTVFNNADVIRKSINSVISKLPDFKKRFEMIIVDNYSSDGTYEILKEYQKEYPNITVIQEKCTRGKGRAIAFNNTKGKYVLTIDFDTVYLEPFKNIVYSYKRIKPLEIYPMFMMRRETMDIIGNWKDLNYNEDIEMTARAISKNVKVYTYPIIFALNQISERREKRYAKRINYYLRLIKTYADYTAGLGLNFKDFKKRFNRLNSFELFLGYLIIRLIHYKTFRYDKNYDNSLLIQKRIIYLNPKILNIPYKYYITVFREGYFEEEKIRKFKNFGLDRSIKVAGNKRTFYIMYNKKADTRIINYYKRYFTNTKFRT